LLNNGGLAAEVAFNILGLDIYWYAIIIVFGMLAAILLCQRLCKYREIKSDIVLDMAIVCIPLGVIGARLYYVAFDSNVWTFAEIFSRSGGLAIYGGVIGGTIGAAIVCLYKKVSLLRILDVAVPCLILAQAIGRWGNFANQEAYGNLVTSEGLKWFPYAVYIEAEGAFFQATFFYESLWNLIGAAVLYYALRRTKTNGVVACGYLVFYGIGRVFIEGLRSDSLYIGASGIRISQLLSGVLIAVGALGIIYLHLRHKRLDGAQDKQVRAETEAGSGEETTAGGATGAQADGADGAKAAAQAATRAAESAAVQAEQIVKPTVTGQAATEATVITEQVPEAQAVTPEAARAQAAQAEAPPPVARAARASAKRTAGTSATRSAAKTAQPETAAGQAPRSSVARTPKMVEVKATTKTTAAKRTAAKPPEPPVK
jgi:phosphatidylglycerol:prolipoprotein diacylglycerol transferase